MGEQRELFETGKRSWCNSLCQSIPPKVRREIIAVLAQMGKHSIQGRMQQHSRTKNTSYGQSSDAERRMGRSDP